jgi:hypothetical protein
LKSDGKKKEREKRKRKKKTPRFNLHKIVCNFEQFPSERITTFSPNSSYSSYLIHARKFLTISFVLCLISKIAACVRQDFLDANFVENGIFQQGDGGLTSSAQITAHAVVHYFSSEDYTRVNYLISSGVPMTPWLRNSICPSLTRPMARTGQFVSTKKREVNIRLAGRPKEAEAACVYRVMQK